MGCMIRRSAVRAILFDPDLREILLIKALVPDTGQQLWFTPGGGINGGESELDCLAREVAEETGLHKLPAAHRVWTRHEQFVFMGEDYDQYEVYYFVPIARFELGQRNLESHETETFLDARWWSLADIACSDDQFVPGDLADLLLTLETQWHSGELPDTPRAVGR